jgi:hypothetical protein
MQRMWRAPETEIGRLLRVLFVRLGAVPAKAGCATVLQDRDSLKAIEVTGVTAQTVDSDATGVEPKARHRCRPTPSVPVNAVVYQR